MGDSKLLWFISLKKTFHSIIGSEKTINLFIVHEILFRLKHY